MTNKFKVYAQTRGTRQLAGDVANAIRVEYDGTKEDNKRAAEKAVWQTIEDLLNAVECKLEELDLN